MVREKRGARLACGDMTANGMLEEIETVDLEVEPIEGERLDEAEDGFAEEPVSWSACRKRVTTETGLTR